MMLFFHALSWLVLICQVIVFANLFFNAPAVLLCVLLIGLLVRSIRRMWKSHKEGNSLVTREGTPEVGVRGST